MMMDSINIVVEVAMSIPVEEVPLPLHVVPTEIKEPITVPCTHCKSSGRSHLCFEAVHQLGYRCDKYTLMMKEHNVDILVQRIEALEKYIAVRELERQTKLPTSIAVEITKYY